MNVTGLRPVLVLILALAGSAARSADMTRAETFTNYAARSLTWTNTGDQSIDVEGIFWTQGTAKATTDTVTITATNSNAFLARTIVNTKRHSSSNWIPELIRLPKNWSITWTDNQAVGNTNTLVYNRATSPN